MYAFKYRSGTNDPLLPFAFSAIQWQYQSGAVARQEAISRKQFVHHGFHGLAKQDNPPQRYCDQVTLVKYPRIGFFR